MSSQRRLGVGRPDVESEVFVQRKVLPVLLAITISLLTTFPARPDETGSGPQTLVAFKDLPPTLNKLLRQAPGVNPEPALRIAYVGFSPDPTDPRLQATKRFRLHRFGPSPTSSEDTQLAGWLSTAWPDLTLIAVGLPKPDDKDEAWNLLPRPRFGPRAQPQVLVLRDDFLLFCRAAAVPREGKEGVLQVFVECWKRACLPVVVTSGLESPWWTSPHVAHPPPQPKGLRGVSPHGRPGGRTPTHRSACPSPSWRTARKAWISNTPHWATSG
jgi:hypothetical protein